MSDSYAAWTSPSTLASPARRPSSSFYSSLSFSTCSIPVGDFRARGAVTDSAVTHPRTRVPSMCRERTASTVDVCSAVRGLPSPVSAGLKPSLHVVALPLLERSRSSSVSLSPLDRLFPAIRLNAVALWPRGRGLHLHVISVFFLRRFPNFRVFHDVHLHLPRMCPVPASTAGLLSMAQVPFS